MKNIRYKRMLLIILPLIVLLYVSIWSVRTMYDYTPVFSENGVWDLRGYDLDHEILRIRGDVEYVENALLTPEEFDSAPGKQIGTVSNADYSTSRSTLLLPPDKVYAVFMVSFDYSHRIWVNGQWLTDVGSPGPSAEAAVPRTSQLIFTVTGADGPVELIQQSSNFVHRAGANHEGYLIGSPQLIYQRQARVNGGNAIIMGSCLFLFIIHLMLYLMMPQYKATLFSALVSLVWFFRTGVTDSKVLSAAFYRLPWQFTFRIEYICLPMTAILVILTLDAMFEAFMSKRVRNLLLAVNGFFVAAFALGGTVWMTHILLYCMAVLGVSAVATVWSMVRVVRREGRIDDQSLIILVGIIFLVIFGTRDALYHYEVTLFFKGTMAPAFFLIYILFQTTATFLGTIREMDSARSREQESRLEAAALRQLNLAKENFLRDMSHELKTPITVMSGYAQYSQELLADSPPELETVDENMERIILESERLERLVSQLLDNAALQTGRFVVEKSRFPVSQLGVQLEAYFPRMDTGGNRLVRNLPEAQCYGDLERIFQVLLNLVSNACRHTRRGVITVTAEARERDMLFSVADTGEGMEAEAVRRAFSPGMTTPSAGSGLGLTICRQIVEAHGGTIDLESAPGAGTLVRFTLPCPQEEGGA